LPTPPLLLQIPIFFILCSSFHYQGRTVESPF
jgi:hypothetical protein